MGWLRRYEFLDNDLDHWAIAAGIALAVLFLVWAVRALLKRRLARAAETETDIDDLALALVRRAKLYLLIFPIVFFATRVLELTPDVRGALKTAAVIAFLFQFGLWSNELVDFWLHRYQRSRAQTDPASVTTIRAFGWAIDVFLWSIIALVAIENLGFDVTTLVAGLGIGGVAVALAVQNILGDLFASLSIVIDKPFVVGDTILSGTDIGTVQHIGLKTTRVRSLSGEEIVFSNADLLKSRVRNFARMTERRGLFTFGVVYETAPEKLEKIPLIVRQAIEKHQNTRFDRAHLKSFGSSSLDYEVVFYVLSSEYVEFMNVQQAVNLDLLRRFAEEGIEFAYPTQTVHKRD
jgi:small-conductance mechanosensitive channel